MPTFSWQAVPIYVIEYVGNFAPPGEAQAEPGGHGYVFVNVPSMRDPFENTVPENPVEAARRGARSALRRRFYAKAETAAVAEGYAVRLDDKPVRTPARRILAAPTLALAEAIAAEWEAQRELIDPAAMPLTRLANAIIDGVAERPLPVAAEIAKYLASDLLFYRATRPPELVERQRRHWEPILAWAAQALGARFEQTEGITHVAQPEHALQAARAIIPDDPWRLGAVHAATTLTGSALIALTLARGVLSAEVAWQAANVDEDWNMQQWGRDALALERNAFRFAELKAAAAILRSLSK
jgi:chaperone required for assembly of F1-ATPase